MLQASQLNCNCDMPFAIYVDWLEEQGWDVSELREMDNEEPIMYGCEYYYYTNWAGIAYLNYMQVRYGEVSIVRGDGDLNNRGSAYGEYYGVAYTQGDTYC